MAKKVPASVEHGPSVILYEVTASGIDQHWNEDIFNSNRLRVRTADYQGNGDFQYECNFPFLYEGVAYMNCTEVGALKLWCSLKTIGGYHVVGNWGYCLSENDELAQVTYFSGANTCTDQLSHVCSAQVSLIVPLTFRLCVTIAYSLN